MSNTKKVVIDPGHGKGERKRYNDGTCETDVVWNAAVLLRELLRNYGHTIVLTKDSRDTSLPVSQRRTISVREDADTFVSLYCNAASNNNNKPGIFGMFYGTNKRENNAPDSEIHAPNGRKLARSNLCISLEVRRCHDPRNRAANCS